MVRKVVFFVMALLLVGAGSAFAALSENLVINGSFENPVPAGSWEGYKDSILGWSSGNGYKIEIQKSGTVGSSLAYEGNQYLELDSDGNSKVMQQINGSAGEYNLSFYYSPRPNTASGSTNDFKVFFDGQEVFSATNLKPDSRYTFWSSFTNTVTAMNDNPWLVFQGAGNQDSLGAFIDAVSLTKTQTTPTPIPAAAWLFITGLSGLAVLRRRKV